IFHPELTADTGSTGRPNAPKTRAFYPAGLRFGASHDGSLGWRQHSIVAFGVGQCTEPDADLRSAHIAAYTKRHFRLIPQRHSSNRPTVDDVEALDRGAVRVRPCPLVA